MGFPVCLGEKEYKKESSSFSHQKECLFEPWLIPKWKSNAAPLFGSDLSFFFLIALIKKAKVFLFRLLSLVSSRSTSKWTWTLSSEPWFQAREVTRACSAVSVYLIHIPKALLKSKVLKCYAILIEGFDSEKGFARTWPGSLI